MMKIGLALPHLGEQATAENIRGFALYAERNGWDSLWTGERLLHPVNPRTPYPAKAGGKLRPETKRVYDSELPDEGRQVANGSWDQIAVDIHRLAAAGVEEVFFDLNSLPGAENLQTQLDTGSRLYEICQTAISTARSESR
jgi:hypothetical protein